MDNYLKAIAMDSTNNQFMVELAYTNEKAIEYYGKCMKTKPLDLDPGQYKNTGYFWMANRLKVLKRELNAK